MKLEGLITKYAKLALNEEISFSDAARKIQEEDKKCRYSFVSLRRFVAKRTKELRKKQKAAADSALNGEATHTYKGRRSITTLEEAVEYFDIDLTRYEIQNVTFNSWDVSAHREGDWTTTTNYQVKVKTKVIEQLFDYQQAKKDLKEFIKKKPAKKQTSDGEGVGVFAISDFHFGTEVNSKKGTIATKPFDSKILFEYFEEFVEYVNSLNLAEVHLAMLGDFIESFTGLNHISSWQGLEKDVQYSQSVIGIYEILFEILSKINNLKRTYMVAGNHDRVTSNRDEDVQGNVAYLLSYMLGKHFEVEYHPFVLSEIIDGIGYIFTHNHHSISKQTGSYMVLNYGFKDLYNVLMGGHFHSRNTKKEFYKTESHVADAANYRIIRVPALFTGNFYSESIGYTSSAGFAHIQANKKKTNVHHFDYGF